MPGKGPGVLKTNRSMADAPTIVGIVAADPASALAAATVTFKRAGNTLESISGAAEGIKTVTKKLDDVGGFVQTWKSTGQRVGTLADDLSDLVGQNRQTLASAISNFNEVSKKVNDVLDAEGQAKLKASIDRLNTLAAKLNEDLATIDPLIKDLGSEAKRTPTTALGSSIYRFNRITYDLGLLTGTLTDSKGRLNTNGTLQNLFVNRELYDNFNKAAGHAGTLMDEIRPIISDLKVFAKKISGDPSSLMRGALQR